ncbi:hypothetical protein [Bacillus velezensis]|uniref:YqgU-like beta propeller domain-containing protein n=1 Tax=Bacillus velezensis TaxID=492670 RepID=UPI000EFB1FC9|nr:hypothetical protein [Bacillus velezensis]TWO88507.1 hypothetical protein EUA42_07755 [Bacillus velezensis]
MRYLVCVLLSAFVLCLAACEPSHQQQDTGVSAKSAEQKIVPLSKKEAEKTEGWLDNRTILYTAHHQLMKYDLFSGKSERLYETKGHIVNVKISRKKQLILVQVTSSGQTELVLMNKQGKRLYHKAFNSYELETAWNPYDPYQMMITVFTETWDFTAYTADMKNGILKKSPVQAPFVHWTSTDEFQYIKQGKTEEEGPLYSYDLQTKKEKRVLHHVIWTDSRPGMTIAVRQTDQSDGDGEFLFQKPASVTHRFPLQKKYESFAPMEYDYDQTHKRFYIFKPEGRSYNLISFDLGDERERTVLKNTEMEPIQISPNGEYALYGFTYDRLISLKTGMTEPIITNEKGV